MSAKCRHTEFPTGYIQGQEAAKALSKLGYKQERCHCGLCARWVKDGELLKSYLDVMPEAGCGCLTCIGFYT